MDYKAYLQTPEWQKKRSERLRIDNYKCQRCGRPMDLEVHHLHYAHIGNEDVYNDLVTLCKYCHEYVENPKREWRDSAHHPAIHNDNLSLPYRADKRLTLRFCRDIESQDYSSGGALNLTNLDVIKTQWKEWLRQYNLPDRDPRASIITSYFRNKRIKMILEMQKAGAAPDDIMARGISSQMVRKYYNNHKLAYSILESSQKEMEDY